FIDMFFKKNQFTCLLLFIGHILCGQIFSVNKIVPVQQHVTIYVHGTTTKLGLKFLSTFCKEVSFGQPGIHHIDQLPQCALLRNDAALLAQQDPERFDVDHFYTFGWSGQLSFNAREIAGKELFEQLRALLKDYKNKYGLYPQVRLLTFSHGGNVALNMVKHLPFFSDEKVYLELIIVACPVQKITEKLIEHDCISQSYVISSTRDLLQVVDFYKHEKKRYFPERFFDTKKTNCCQIEVKINNRGIGHIDLMRSFMLHIPITLKKADSWLLRQPYLYVKGLGDHEHMLDSGIISCEIQDPCFRFYNVFNLPQVIAGKRKPEKKIKKHAMDKKLKRSIKHKKACDI
ncbi:MAG TPA: hypothetical protein VLG50_04140, partial [Candidatus Saccharimonadales bacterium]|nr:hypothetical protein [Candidatus Saccharimonadales bacterium]